MTNEKNAVGRPTKYNPEFCEKVIEAMESGYSFTAFCGIIGVCKDTGYEWIKEYPDFSDAVKIARAKRLVFLETRLYNIGMPPAQITATIFALKNADRQEWTDRVVQEQTGENGGPVRTAVQIEFVK